MGGAGGGRIIDGRNRLPDIKQVNEEVSKDLKTISKIEGNIPKLIEIKNSRITGITIIVREDIKNASITVQHLEITPKNISELHGAYKVYKYFKINSNIQSENIVNISINFKIGRDWILDNNIDENTIKLNKFNALTNEWVVLQTAFINESDSYLFYSAESVSFSIFVITGTEKVEEQIINETILEENQKVEEPNKRETTPCIPGFSIAFVITIFLIAWLVRIRIKKE